MDESIIGSDISKKTMEEFNNYTLGNDEVRNRIVVMNMPLAYYIVNNFVFTHKSFYTYYDDLIQCAMIGLIKAVQCFDSNTGKLFGSYASVCIKHEICDFYNRKVSRNDKRITGINLEEFYDLSDSSINIEDDCILKIQSEALYKAMECLTDRERDIIEKYYGLNNHNSITLEDIGKIYGISRQRVNAIMKLTLYKLKCILENKEYNHQEYKQLAMKNSHK